MSYCQVIEFIDNKPETGYDFRNAWGGHARIWNALFDRYLKDPLNEYDSWMLTRSQQKLWDIVKRQDLQPFERIVMAATFDYAIISKEHFATFAADLRKFVQLYPVAGATVDHLPAWADLIESNKAQAIGFRGTSVAENVWIGYNGETDESVPYDLATGTRHFEIYQTFLPTPAAAE
jgi:hypothetical protein